MNFMTGEEDERSTGVFCSCRRDWRRFSRRHAPLADKSPSEDRAGEQRAHRAWWPSRGDCMHAMLQTSYTLLNEQATFFSRSLQIALMRRASPPVHPPPPAPAPRPPC